MIYVDIKGNLGNQLFEYAFAKYIQKQTGQQICLNCYNLIKYKPEYTFSLQQFNLPDDIIIEKHQPMPFLSNSYTFFSRVMRKLFPRLNYWLLSQLGIYMWISSEYKKIEVKKHKNYYLSGYWQSEKYFSAFRDEILQDFQTSGMILETYTGVIETNKRMFEKMQAGESVCVSIRRGDYITNEKYKMKFFVCDEAYFKTAIKRVKAEIPNATLCFFSDDIEWVKENIDALGLPTLYESGNDPLWEKIRLMSACKHFVLSNSSFSWWVQYLSTNENKIVYTPTKWYADGVGGDLVDKEWHDIEV